VETVALRTPDDLDAARRLIAEHGHPSPLAGYPTRRLIVSPFMGTFKACVTRPGVSLAPGAPIGSLVCRRGELPIAAPHGGTLVEWLVEDGDPVFPGQPLARLHPEALTS
jgi:[acyl-carrier-protein] S-malonyltransferase